MTNIMDYIKSGKGLPPLEDNIPPMPEVKPPREKINFRQYYKLDESDLKTSLEEFGLSISDQTPYIQQNRPQEIKAWLENNTNEQDVRYVSLDDDYSYDAYKEYGIEECLVKTSFYESNGGLIKEHVKKAIKILNGE